MQKKNYDIQTNEDIKLEINGDVWDCVPNFNESISNDNHFVVKIQNEGTAVIIFGDGERGARLPTGKDIKVTFNRNKYFNGVLLQQGEVQQDNDWNETKININRYYGIYRGLITHNVDPKSSMRIQVKVPTVLGSLEVWASPCIPIGTSVIPPIGGNVWITFEHGDPALPVWMGTWNSVE